MERNDKRVYLDLNYAFGSNCSAGFKDCVGIMEEDKAQPKIIFPVGKCIAKKSLERSDMEFIRLSQNLQSVECMCISPQKTHIAICEKPKNQNILIMTLYSLKAMDTEKKVFRYVPNAKMKASTFKAFAFSPSQQKFMCCLTGDPDYQLLFIDNSRMRALAFSNFSIKDVTRIAISPNQSHLISASGKNFFKLYKVEQYAFKPLEDVKKLPKNRNFTQHAWCQKTKILLGTDRGEVYLIISVGNKYEVKREFLNAFNQPTTNISITAICPFSRGFILGSDTGKFTLWVKKEDQEENYEDQESVDLVRKWSTSAERQAEVTCIDISAKQDTVVIAFKNNDIATIDMNEILPQTLETVEALQKATDKTIFFDYLFKGFHNAPITGMDVCLQRPLLATCSKYDNTIRIWNYKNPRCELLRMFSFKNKDTGLDQKTVNPLINLAFHPTGYYLAVACVDKLRFYHVLNTQLRPYREIVVKGACQLKFSRGGNWLAVAYPVQKYNAHSINIYNAYTLQEVAHLAQHSNQVTDLQWTKNDEFLISSGSDGAVIQWRSQDWSFKKFIQTNSKYSSALWNPYSGTLLGCGSQSAKSVVREIKLQKQREIYQKVHHTSFKINKLKLLLSHWNYPAIVAGADDGSIKVFNVGFDNLVEQSLNSHCKQVVKLETSPCGRYVFTIGEDGVLFVYQVSITYKDGTLVRKKVCDGKEEQLQMNPYVSVVDDFLADIVMVNKGQIDEHARAEKQLRLQIQELGYKLTQAGIQSKKKLDLEVRNIKTTKNKEIEDQQQKIEALKKQIKSLQTTYENDTKNNQDKNVKAAQDLQTLYERKLAIEGQKYYQLEQQMIQLRMLQRQQIEQLKNQHSQNISLLKSQFMDSFSKAQKVYNVTKERSQKTEKVYDEKVSQIQEEYQNQIKQINNKRNKEDKQNNKIINDLNVKLSNALQDKNGLLQEKNRILGENEQLKINNNELAKDLDEFKSMIDEKNEQLVEKDQSTKTKDRLIGELQHKINQLMKTKHVLSYKATQMRRSMEPKEAEIDKLKEELFKLEQEFEGLLQEQQRSVISMEKVQKEKGVLSKSLKQQIHSTKEKELLLEKISLHIIKCMQARGKEVDHKFYYREMAALYEKYVEGSGDKHPAYDPKGVDEMGRQLVHLQKSVVQANKAAEKLVVRRAQQISKKTKENAQLIYDLNQIRKINKQMQSQLRNKQKTIENLEREKKMLQSIKAVEEHEKQKTYELQQKQFGKANIAKVGLETIQSSGISNDDANIQSKSNNAMKESYGSNKERESTKKGKLMKGSNYDSHSQASFSKMNKQNRQQKQKQKYLSRDSQSAGIMKQMKQAMIRKEKDSRPVSEQVGGHDHQHQHDGLKSMAIQADPQ